MHSLRLKPINNFIITSLILFTSLPILTHAEITTDGTLGLTQTLPGPDFQITADLGRQIGGNLFHSFNTFNINKGETATFLGPTSVANIISRVTGGQQSIINGQLIANIPQANLYLINPDGFILGPHAKLDLQGSFHLSSASFLRLGEIGSFDSRRPDESILVSAPPSAFGFLDNPAAITIQGSQLATREGRTLSILGGKTLNLEQGWLRAIAGRINLAAVAAANQLETRPTGLFLQNQGGLGEITFTESTIDVGKSDAGDIYIRGGQFFIDNTNIIANTFTEIKTSVIDIEVEQLRMKNRASIDSRAFGTSPGGQINIKVTGEASLTDSNVLTSSMGTLENAGDAGNISLQMDNLDLINSTIASTTDGPGNGGDITIQAIHHINLMGSADRPTIIQASSKQAGNAGRLHIRAQDLTLSYTQIDNNSFGGGQGGSIRIELANRLNLSNQAYISADSKGTGAAGNIYLQSAQLDMHDSQISTAAEQANGGNILINTDQQVNLEQSQISATVSGGQGNGGNLAISNPRFFQLANSQVSANASAGRGGVVLIVTETSLNNYNSLITASSETGLDGEVKIDSIYQVGIDSLPGDFLRATDLIKNPCASRTATQYSSFKLIGRQGLPNAPDDLQGNIIWPRFQ